MRTFSRTTAATAAAIASVALLAAACGGSGDTAGSPATAAAVDSCDPNGVTIDTIYAQQGAQAAEQAKKTLEAEHPGLTVNLELSSAAGYDALTQQVVTDLASGRRHDVVMVGLGQVRYWVDEFSPAPINPEALNDTYDRRFLSIGEVDGKPYVAPFQVSMPVLYTNTDLAGQAGVTAPPTSSSELLAAARAVGERTDAAAVALPRDGIADWVAQAYIQSAGATFVNPDGTAGFDSDQGRDGLSIYADLGAEKLAEPVAFADAMAMFTRGELAYMISSPASAASMTTQVGDRFDWSVSAFPVPDGGTPSLPAGGNGWIVLSDDPCRAAFANEMIGAMLDPTVIATSAKTFSYVPVDTRAAAELKADPAARTQVGFAWSFDGTLTPWGGWHGDATPKVNKIITDLVTELTNGASVDDVLPGAVRQIDGAAR
ncbi:extracellular solute-binding protein [Parafrankia elaeagni]|uniref:extracellular solute-binding protein n=1 Tax=Parafrankia elaeagni TaxID=222534 RepID=UPI00036A24F3|nr:extracellular solute-binding protein [Parafrankia elaeagni]